LNPLGQLSLIAIDENAGSPTKSNNTVSEFPSTKFPRN